MKVKTSELSGVALDWAVAKAYGASKAWLKEFAEGGNRHYSPSTNWIAGGPIIERELIEWRKTEEGSINCWIDQNEIYGEPYGYGPTLLVAAMR